MKYKGYTIEYENGHYKVTSPDGSEWREDTVRDVVRAVKEEIDRELEKETE